MKRIAVLIFAMATLFGGNAVTANAAPTAKYQGVNLAHVPLKHLIGSQHFKSFTDFDAKIDSKKGEAVFLQWNSGQGTSPAYSTTARWVNLTTRKSGTVRLEEFFKGRDGNLYTKYYRNEVSNVPASGRARTGRGKIKVTFTGTEPGPFLIGKAPTRPRTAYFRV